MTVQRARTAENMHMARVAVAQGATNGTYTRLIAEGQPKRHELCTAKIDFTLISQMNERDLASGWCREGKGDVAIQHQLQWVTPTSRQGAVESLLSLHL